ncbi:hypothetical protein NB554_04795 [Vibrio alginolyticus]|uniref:hypothetical protein n=1 Tax=Vibrio alginolyticus TaxID=663 RepID=UPI001BD4101C|nr:hypothetical protein [Vibrio alginolyticus]EJL6782143.1 hypothetical protein [Vibrio alginolyticus]EJX1243423.1 hypothetical protein [Vibrio alginolyticus]EJX1247134.1 hypothetical protein [Vibrio alginolyticus]MBS9905295.1 hypothetical protein [Vibrio alginolyticus]MBS9983230.1 hypothetical protein [Vibrio alginolyticus]
MRSVVAMLQKEWLENPLVLRIPLFVLACGVILFVSLMSNDTLQHNMFFQMSFGGDVSDIHKELGDDINTLITGGAGLLSILLAVQYFPRTLRKERAEGSIMFWRSMPVSDIKTHLVKLGFGLLVIPLVCSVLVLAANLMLWLLNISTDHQLALLYRQVSLGYVLLHWGEFLIRMFFAGILLLPLALTAMAISQKVNSPLVILFIAIYALRWMPIALFGFYGLDQFFSEVLYLPLHAIITPNPFNAIPQAGWLNVGIYAFIGILGWTASLKFSRTIQ